MSDAKIRNDLFQFFTAQMGAEQAGRVMDLFPPAGADQLVTRDYLHREMAEQSRRLTREIAEQGQRLTGEMASSNRQILLANVAMWITTVAAVIIT